MKIMYKITLKGPQTTLTATTDSYEKYIRFVNWLKEAHPIKGKRKRKKNVNFYLSESPVYPVETEMKLKDCKIQARLSGFTIM